MPQFETITTIERLQELIPQWLNRPFAFDTESTGLSYIQDKILGVSLCFEDEQCYYVVFQHTQQKWDGSTFVETFVDRSQGLGLLLCLFAQPDVVMVAHNAKHDLKFLSAKNIRISGRLFDTLLSSQLLDENRRNGLKDLAPSVGVEYDKYQTMVAYEGYTKNEILGVPLPQTAEYAMNDALATWRLYQRFSVELQGEPFERVFYDVWMPLMVTLQQMEEHGIRTDREKVKELLAEHESLTAQYEKEVRTEGLKMLAAYVPEEIPDSYLQICPPELYNNSFEDNEGYLRVTVDEVDLPIITPEMKGKTARWSPRIPTFNVGSDKQLADVLYNHLGLGQNLPIPLKTTASGDVSVDKDNLNTLLFFAGEEPPKIIESLLSWRKSQKFISTYLLTLLEKTDDKDRIHTSFHQAVSDYGNGGTATGRLSSSQPNLQNQVSQGALGEQCRKLYIAEEGHKLIVSDYSNLELRILAHYSQDETLMRSFAEGLDVHSLTAATQNNLDYDTFMQGIEEENPDYKRMRRIGKVSNFGLAYGMGPRKFQRYLLVNAKVFVSVEEAANLIAAYNETYKGAEKWKERAVSYAKRLGYVKTLSGRLRRLPELHSRDRYEVMRAERQAVNAIIQGSASDVISEAMPPLQNALRSVGGSLLLQVHDEIVGTAPEEYATTACKLFDIFMVDKANRQLTVPLVAEAHIGTNWYDAKA